MAQLIESKTFALLSVVFVLPLLMLACRDFDDRAGSSGLTPTSEISAAGVWEGNYSTLIGVGDAGTVTFVIEQDPDGTLSGCSCWTGSVCWDDGLFTGAVKGDRVQTATVLQIPKDPVGTLPERLDPTVVVGAISIIGDVMTGSFEVSRDDPERCDDNLGRTGDVGTLNMRRVAPDVDVASICAEIQDDIANDDCSTFVIPLD